MEVVRRTAEDRRVLAERETRCIVAARQLIDRVLYENGITGNLTRNQAMQVLRQAQSQRYARFVSQNGFETTNMFAMRGPDGSISFDACRGVEGATLLPRCDPWRDAERLGSRDGLEYVRAWTKWRKKPGRPRLQCVCTDRELVALERLLEAGDKDAEKLAVACRRGGRALGRARSRR